jgi:hypothetical protein
MTKYKVGIARTETVIYYFDIEAEDKSDAEELAFKDYIEGDYVSKEVVWGEEDAHSIEEVKP